MCRDDEAQFSSDTDGSDISIISSLPRDEKEGAFNNDLECVGTGMDVACEVKYPAEVNCVGTGTETVCEVDDAQGKSWQLDVPRRFDPGTHVASTRDPSFSLSVSGCVQVNFNSLVRTLWSGGWIRRAARAM